jgi:hypothetical protein
MRQTFAFMSEAGRVVERKRPMGLVLLSMRGKRNDTQSLSYHSTTLYPELVYGSDSPGYQTNQ